MNKTNDNIRIYYDENPLIAQSCGTVFSYSKKAEKPLLWVHYSHRQIRSQYTAVRKNLEWCSLFVFLSGNISILIGDHLYNMKSGDAIVLRDHENYASIFPEASYVDYYQIFIPSEFFKSSNASDLFYIPFYDRKTSEKNLVSPTEQDRFNLIQHLKALDDISKEKSEHGDILMYSHIIQLAEIIYSTFTSKQKSSFDSKIPKKLNNAILYIHNNFTTIESVDEVSKSCEVSNAYLARIFKKHLSCTPKDYITALRISHAKYLLSLGKSITEVCFESGFNNYTYFISKFKAITGTTPSKFTKDIK